MSTVDPSKEGLFRPFAVALRSESRLWLKPAEHFVAGWVVSGSTPINFSITSQFATIDAHLVPVALIFRTQLFAKSPNDALALVQLAATQLVVALWFIQNAYIEPPRQWYAYEVGDPSDWRFLKQSGYEERLPALTHQTRRLKVSLAETIPRRFWNRA